MGEQFPTSTQEQGEPVRIVRPPSYMARLAVWSGARRPNEVQNDELADHRRIETARAADLQSRIGDEQLEAARQAEGITMPPGRPPVSGEGLDIPPKY